MKKKLAILLSLALLVSTVFSFGLTTSAESAAEGTVLFSTDFSTAEVTGLAALKTSGTYSFSNNSAGTRVNKIVDGAWVVKETEANTGRWRGAFGTYSPAVPLVWNEGNVYVVEFDWTMPVGYGDTADLRVIMETDLGQGNNNNGTRAYELKVIETGTTSSEAASGHVTWTVTLDSETAQNAIAADTALRVIFRGKGLTGFTIDNLKITDVTPAAPTSPVTFEGVSERMDDASSDYRPMRFLFELQCTGVTKVATDSYRRVIADDATVTVDGKAYPLTDFGTLLSADANAELTLDTEDAIYGVRAYNLYAVGEGYVQYTAVVTNMPKSDPAKKIYARPYVTYTDNGTQKTLYGETVAYCLNDLNV